LFPTGPFEDSNRRKASRIVKLLWCRVSSRQLETHVSSTTWQKLLQFGWDVLPHPPYSPDIAPSDFNLFRSSQNFLIGKNFTSLEDCKKHLEVLKSTLKSFSPIKLRSSGRMEFSNYLKGGAKLLKKTVNTFYQNKIF